jgi:hypothetical protein
MAKRNADRLFEESCGVNNESLIEGASEFEQVAEGDLRWPPFRR